VNWLDEDSDHIWTAISAMVSCFRTLAQLALSDTASALGNTSLAEQLINGHVVTQVLASRRLVDNTRGVISLQRAYFEFGCKQVPENTGLLSSVPSRNSTEDRRKMAHRRTPWPDGPSMRSRAHRQNNAVTGANEGANRTEKYHLLRRWRREWNWDQTFSRLNDAAKYTEEIL